MSIQEIKSAIIAYETLPSQIDYSRPWQIKAEAAWRELEKLPKDVQNSVGKSIKESIDYYDTPLKCGLTPSQLDEMF